ncbi:MAG TPA: OB-fold domain-containing protein [Candidatus Acidoferrales bacterium]|nr:OB-fold domain-containing protein [Candidatus Acidoferrales bacterium]
MHPDFPLPDVNWGPTRELWSGAARGELRITRCDACGRYVWYPEAPCRHCGGAALTWTRVSGRGTLFSWSVLHYAWIPQFREQLPFVSGLVALEEDPGVRLVSYIVDCGVDALRCDMPVRVVFRPLRYPGVAREVIAPLFAPLEK